MQDDYTPARSQANKFATTRRFTLPVELGKVIIPAFAALVNAIRGGGDFEEELRIIGRRVFAELALGGRRNTPRGNSRMLFTRSLSTAQVTRYPCPIDRTCE